MIDPRLSPWIAAVWTGTTAQARVGRPLREQSLPTGAAHLVVRLEDAPLWIRDSARDAVQSLVGAMVSGARVRGYLREASAPTQSVGVVLRPGAVSALFGCPAHAVAGRHVALDALVGCTAAAALHGALREARTPHDRLLVLESFLRARFAAAPRVPAPLTTLLQAHSRIADAAAAAGLSHRRYIAGVRRETGLTPQGWRGVRRFQRAVALLHGRPDLTLVEVALAAGFADQSHLGRDFLARAGTTPETYRRAAPIDANHLPLAAP